MVFLEGDAGPLGLMSREPARYTSEPGSNHSWDATVHPVCETFNVMHPELMEPSRSHHTPFFFFFLEIHDSAFVCSEIKERWMDEH